MDSPTGALSNSSGQQKVWSDLEKVMDQRKLKRMISNRNSARRSRARKQKHLDDLVSQVAELRKESHQLLTDLHATTQSFLAVESENAILRDQVAELSHRLQSLDEIASFVGGWIEAEIEVPSAYGMEDPAAIGCGLWNFSSQPVMMTAASNYNGYLI